MRSPEAESLASPLHRTARDAFDVELLHDDEEDGNRNGNDDAAGAELREVVVAVHLVHHREQTQRDGLARRRAAGHHQVSEHEVHPRREERVDNRVDDNRLGQRQNDFPENGEFIRAFQIRRFAQGLAHRVEEALRNQVAHARTCAVHDNQACQRAGQPKLLHDEVNRDHAQEAGEEVQDDSDIHQRLARLEAHTRHRVRHHQHEQRRNDTGEAGNDERVEHPLRELVDRVGRKQRLVMVKRVRLGEERREVRPLVHAEGRDNQPQNRNQPEGGKQRQHNVASR